MQPFRDHRGIAVPFEEQNVDTDQIIPSRFLLKPRAFDHGALLFHDLRQETSDVEPFVLDRPAYRGASIIVGNENFGCGSSREQAAYALYDYGIRVVIAPSFGDIFRVNCVKNGLLPATVDNPTASTLRQKARNQPGIRLTVNLKDMSIGDDSQQSYRFMIDHGLRDRLLSGEDELSRTQRLQQSIDDFEHQWERAVSWAKPNRE
jgi:3-isopropylmalate/(R)-2-methylmalate dehydratase small subunit